MWKSSLALIRPLVTTMRLMPISTMVESSLLPALRELAAGGRDQHLLDRVVVEVDVLAGTPRSVRRSGFGSSSAPSRTVDLRRARRDVSSCEVPRVGAGRASRGPGCR